MTFVTHDWISHYRKTEKECGDKTISYVYTRNQIFSAILLATHPNTRQHTWRPHPNLIHLLPRTKSGHDQFLPLTLTLDTQGYKILLYFILDYILWELLLFSRFGMRIMKCYRWLWLRIKTCDFLYNFFLKDFKLTKLDKHNLGPLCEQKVLEENRILHPFRGKYQKIVSR